MWSVLPSFYELEYNPQEETGLDLCARFGSNFLTIQFCLLHRLNRLLQRQSNMRCNNQKGDPTVQQTSTPIPTGDLTAAAPVHTCRCSTCPAATVTATCGTEACVAISRLTRDATVPECTDDVTRLLGHAVCRAHQVCGESDWGYTGVRDADVCEAVDAEICVDHAALLAG